MNYIKVICKKEIIDNLRDKKALFNTFIQVFLMPLLIFSGMVLGGYKAKKIDAKPTKLSVSGEVFFPQLVEFIRGSDIDVSSLDTSKMSIKEHIEKDKSLVVLKIESDFAEEFNKADTPAIELYYNSENSEAERKQKEIMSTIYEFKQRLTMQRLALRGVSSSFMDPFTINSIDQNDTNKILEKLLGVIPGILVFMVFIGAYAIIADMFSGEKERYTMEPLLQLPIKVESLYWGKFAAAMILTIVSLVLAGFVLFGIMNSQIQQFIGISLSIDLVQLGAAFAIMLPLAILAVGLQSLICAYCKTNKEAQTYISILMMVAFLPSAFLSSFAEGNEALIQKIPTVGQVHLITKFWSSYKLDLPTTLQLSVITIVLATVVIKHTISYMKSEKFVN